MSKEISTKQLVDTTFWLKPWLKLILFGSVFPDLAKVLAKTNSEPYNISISLIRHFSSYFKKLFLEDWGLFVDWQACGMINLGLSVLSVILSAVNITCIHYLEIKVHETRLIILPRPCFSHRWEGLVDTMYVQQYFNLHWTHMGQNQLCTRHL